MKIFFLPFFIVLFSDYFAVQFHNKFLCIEIYNKKTEVKNVFRHWQNYSNLLGMPHSVKSKAKSFN